VAEVRPVGARAMDNENDVLGGHYCVVIRAS
jgi:hypothetical protein